MKTKAVPKTEPAPEPAAVPQAAPPPPPEPDPLRVKIFAMKDPQEKEAIRARLLAMVMKSVVDMSAHDVQEVAQFVDIVEHNGGCDTPAENFIADLVFRHYFMGGITPDVVHERLEDPEESFQLEFDSAVDIARRFNAQYAAVLAAPPADQPAQ